MKKILSILAALAMFTSSGIQAQTQPQNQPQTQDQDQDLAFQKGTFAITAGYGVPNLARLGLRVIYGSFTDYTVSGYGPLLLKAEYGVLDKLGVGIVMGHSSTTLSYNERSSYYQNGTSYSYTYQESLRWTNFSLGAHANFHFARKEKVDAYVGGGLGYTFHNVTYSSNDPYGSGGDILTFSPSSVFYAVTIGMRYYFSPNIGFYFEGGIEKGSLLQGGLAIKF